MNFRLKNRRGATMVLVGVAMVALVGIMAFALDFSRMYLFRAQVHVSSDAAALAGADRLARGLTSVAADTAVAYGQRNLVERTVPTITTNDIVPGTWDFTAGTFTPAAGGSWTASTNNAVQATSRYTANYRFGQIFGFSTRLRTATSIAAVGSVGSTDCIRPWAVPYQTMLDILYPPANTRNAATYNLTSADVVRLAAMTSANNFFLKIGSASSGVVNGNFYGVRLPPILYANGTAGNPWSGGNNYSNALGFTCAQLATAMAAQTSNPNIGIGDWLQAENGNMAGPTGQGVATLCQTAGNGGTTPSNASGNATFTCNVPVSIKMTMWATSGNAPGVSGCGGACFLVKYIGVFAVTGYTKGTGSNPDGVTGYFSALVTSGRFSGTPGPVKRIALVQ